MAKVRWFVKQLQMDGDATLSIRSDHQRATYDLSDGGSIVLTGEKLKVDPGNPGELGSGTVTRVVFRNEDGSTGMTVDGKFSAAAIGDAATANDAYGIFYDVLFEGNDTITGSEHGQSIWGGKGDDEIQAGAGKDILYGQAGDDDLTGGKAMDTFLFYDEAGDTDTIRDLDIKGQDADFIYISDSVAVLDIRSAGGGDDTKLILDTGSSILVKSVTKAQFNDYWDVT